MSIDFDFYHFRLPPNPESLLRNQEYALFLFHSQQRPDYLAAALKFVLSQMGKGKLDYAGQKLLYLLEDCNYCEALTPLKNYLLFIDNEEDKKCVQKVIDYFSYIQTHINNYPKYDRKVKSNKKMKKEFKRPILNETGIQLLVSSCFTQTNTQLFYGKMNDSCAIFRFFLHI